MQLSRSAGAEGSEVTASGSGFAPGSTVQLSLGGDTLSSATTDSSGDFDAIVRIPAGTDPGHYDMAAVGPDAAGGTRVLSAIFTVTGGGVQAAAQADDDSSSLPSTGSSPVPLLVVGVALVATGVFATKMGRRKRARE